MIIVGILIAIIIIVGFYVFSIVNDVIELEEESPLDSQKKVNDALDTMSDATKSEFEKQTEFMKDKVIEMEDIIPDSVKLISESVFKPRAHEVEGKVLLIEDNGKNILRFEDFETINGPGLYIYLSSGLGDNDIVDLGKIKATKGNVNYEIPDGTDISKYNKVLVWCQPFGVLFSYAELN